MCRPGAACAPICTSVCPLSAQLANLTAILGGPASTTPNRSSPSVTGPPKPTTARYLGIGKATSSWALATAAQSAPWWSALPGSPSCCTCPTTTPPRPSPRRGSRPWASCPTICDARSPGIEAARWPTGRTSSCSSTLQCSSPTPIHPGSVAPTRTPTACCGSGLRRAPTSAATPRPTSNAFRTNSTADPGPHSTSPPRPKASPPGLAKPHSCCTNHLTLPRESPNFAHARRLSYPTPRLNVVGYPTRRLNVVGYPTPRLNVVGSPTPRLSQLTSAPSPPSRSAS